MNKSCQPPRLLLRFFRWFCHPEYVEDIEGDLLERFEKRVENTSIQRAKWHFTKEVIMLFRPAMIKPMEGDVRMNYYGLLKSHLKFTLRGMQRDKAISMQSIVGLGLGLACTAGIYLWIAHEFSYNRFHEKANQIYQVELLLEEWEKSVVTPAPLAAALAEEYPEVVNATRYSYLSEEVGLAVGEKRLIARGAKTDRAFFEMFDFQFHQGSNKNFVHNAIILTETLSSKLFGSQSGLGQLLTTTNGEVYMVTAILEDVPQNSSFQFDFLLPFGNSPQQDESKAWGAWFCATFIELDSNADPQLLLEKSKGFKTLYTKINKPRWSSELVALPEIYFHDKMAPFFPKSGDIRYVWIFTIAGILIFILSGVNYVSLATSRFLRQFKQVGLEKILGAGYWQTSHKYFVEAIVQTFIAILLGCVLLILLQQYLGIIPAAVFSALDTSKILFTLSGLIGSMILLITVFPALLFRSVRPIALLKRTGDVSSTVLSLRKTLVVFQFIVCICLLSGTLIFQEQLAFIQNKDLGYDKENLLSVKLTETTEKKLEALKNELHQHPGILHASRSTFEYIYFDTQLSDWEGKITEGTLTMRPMEADAAFPKTFGIKLIAGRFYEGRPADEQAVVINEEAAKQMGMNSPIGKKVKLPWNQQEKTIIGVVNDFNYWGLTNPIEPVFIFNGNAGNLYIRLSDSNTFEARAFVETTFETLYPEQPFNSVLLSDRFAQQHAAHEQTGRVFTAFGIVSLLTACFGLLAMVTFSIEQRTKEMGIRKVIGAAPLHIMGLLSKDFALYITIAFVLAVPICWLAMENWLQVFSYRINLSLMHFVWGGILVFIIASVTIFFKVVGVAFSNPVDSLKYE